MAKDTAPGLAGQMPSLRQVRGRMARKNQMRAFGLDQHNTSEYTNPPHLRDLNVSLTLLGRGAG
jgi:hypothetical protein